MSDLHAAASPEASGDDAETLVLAPPPETDVLPEPDLDPGDIVEAAEQMLREAVPHDYDVLVIGGGPGGYVAAIRAAQLGARVGLIEERELGGVCLNRGCIPTKTLLESVGLMRLLRRAAEYGVVLDGGFRPDFAAMNVRKHEVIAALRDNVQHLLDTASVKVLRGHGKFTGPHTVEITEPSGTTHRVVAVDIIIATGSLPQRLPVPGADLPGVMTSDDLLQDESTPRHLLVVGAGAVGVEFAYLYHELGARSTLLEMSHTILPQEDPDIGLEMSRILEVRGVDIVTRAKLESIEPVDGGLRVSYRRDDETKFLDVDRVLLAAGRVANTAGLDLEAAGVKHEHGCIHVDEFCQTNIGGVYAIGDCIRQFGWAHLASAEGKMVAERAMNHDTHIDLRHVPSCYYTHPEIASVGLTEAAARDAGTPVRTGTFHFRTNGRALAAADHDGFVKVVINAATEELLGCQIIGPRATDLINEAVLALKTGQTVDQMVGAIHAHPTFSEALPEAALMARDTPLPPAS